MPYAHPESLSNWEATLKKAIDKVHENAIKSTGEMPPKGGTSLSDKK